MMESARTHARQVFVGEVWMVVLSAVIGFAAAISVAGLVRGTSALQQALFAVREHDVSAATDINPWRSCLTPILGGVLVALTGWVINWRRIKLVDPIEANALYGGRLPIVGSLLIVLQTVLSNAFGASVGMEAGYTQGGAAFASALGSVLKIDRSDLRTLVGCGAAGAITAAFDAPLTGSFYAFELVIAVYTLATLAPVVVSALTAMLTIHLVGAPAPLPSSLADNFAGIDYTIVIVTGLCAAAVAIATMRGVGLVEEMFRRAKVPIGMRPAVGGMLVGLISLETPAVLASGHGALHSVFHAACPVRLLAALVVLKMLASTVSIGSGFRGGLFFASLLLGVLVGKLVALLCGHFLTLNASSQSMAIVGMGAMASAVLGATLAMVFLALETTHSLPLTIAVLTASVVASVTVKRAFGFSFATWRFHLRGEAIHSAADIGWVRELTVNRMMRRDIPTVRCDLGLAEFQAAYPLGSRHSVIGVDDDQRYAGLVFVSDAYRDSAGPTTIRDLLRVRRQVLLPCMNIRDCTQAFAASGSEELAVVDAIPSMRVVGLLTEQCALRRYTTELDQRSFERQGG